METPKIPKNPLESGFSNARKALENLTASSRDTAKLLIDMLKKDSKVNIGALPFNRARIVKAIANLASGGQVATILSAVGETTGKIITQAQATKLLQAKLDAETAQKAIDKSAEVQKLAIEKGAWNRGVTYGNVDSPTTAIGDSGTNGGSNSIGSFFGG